MTSRRAIRRARRIPARKRLSAKGLVLHRMENVSKTIFRQYFKVITDLIGRSPGIYALYDEGDLYYVGKATDLKSRVKSHLRDRHLANWTHFSLYLVRRSQHMDDLESLVVRVANPRGNRVLPRGRTPGTLLKQLKSAIRRKMKEELAELFGSRKAHTRDEERDSETPLQGLVQRRTRLYRRYKGKDFYAVLTPRGRLKMGKVSFKSPTAAARIIVRRPVNGWSFWNVKDASGDWVKLKELRR